MWVIRAGIHKILVRIANREDPDQTASYEAVLSGSALFVQALFDWQIEFGILEHLPYVPNLLNKESGGSFVCFDSLHPSQQFFSHIMMSLPLQSRG